MRNNKIFDTLRVLNKNEFKEFGKFIKSPFHNNRSEVVRFYDSIKIYYPQFSSNDLKANYLFSKIYPGKKYNDALLRKVFSLTFNLIMDFISINSFKNNEIEFNIKLLYELYNKKLNNEFEKRAKKIENLLKKSLHTIEYYEYKFKYISKMNGFYASKINIPDYQKELDEYIEEFLAIALLLYHRLGVTSNLYGINYDKKFYNEVISFIEKGGYTESTLIILYYNLLKLVDTQEEKYFFKLIDLSSLLKDKLDEVLKYNIYVTLLDYSLNKIYKGNFDYRKHLFNISKKYFGEYKNLSIDGYMNSMLFTAVVRNAAHMKEFEWAETFEKTYKSQLDPSIVYETINYSKAFIEFEKGHYEKSLEYIYKVNSDKLSTKINTRNLIIMLYYELGYLFELPSQIDSYKHFVKRNKYISKTLKERCIPFLQKTSELIRIKLNGEINQAVLFKRKLDKYPYFNLKEWLISKTEEIINKAVFNKHSF